MKLKYDLESDIDKESIKEIVYMAALKEIIRQVSVHSCLRGCLLKNTVEVLSLI